MLFSLCHDSKHLMYFHIPFCQRLYFHERCSLCYSYITHTTHPLRLFLPRCFPPFTFRSLFTSSFPVMVSPSFTPQKIERLRFFGGSWGIPRPFSISLRQISFTEVHLYIQIQVCTLRDQYFLLKRDVVNT